MSDSEEEGWNLPTMVSNTVAAVPEGWRPKLVKFMAHFIGSKMQRVADQVADHMDNAAGRSLIRNELAKAAAAKAVQNPELVDRTLQRLCGDLLDGQQNIEQIAILAAEEIVADETPPADEDVANNWRRKFSSYAEEVYDPDMQRVWAKILAGEFKTPGTFSFRTLRIVSEMGPEVANIFARIGADRFADNAIYVGDGQWKKGESFVHLNILQDWGLVQSAAGNTVRFVDRMNGLYCAVGVRVAAVIQSASGPETIEVPIVPYTDSGSELLRLLPPNNEMEVIERVSNFIKGKLPDGSSCLLIVNDGGPAGFKPGLPIKVLWGDPSVSL